MIFNKFSIIFISVLLLVALALVTGCVSSGAQTPDTTDATPTPKPTPTEEPAAALPTTVPTGAPTPDTTPLATSKPSPLPKVPGSSWISPDEISVTVKQKFTTDIKAHTGAKKLHAYGFAVTYDKAIVLLDQLKGNNGVEAGPDGFVNAINANEAGRLIVAGFDVNGKGPGTNLSLIIIHWTAIAPGETDIMLAVNNFNDDKGNIIGVPVTAGAFVSVK
jgi:hypothetical protein